MKKFVKKEGKALIQTSRYLMSCPVGERIKTIDNLADDFSLSVGYIAKAIKFFEENRAITLDKRGRNGTFLIKQDINKLLQSADMNMLVCAMPLPYTRYYEGLASGLKELIGGNCYFAHMRGAKVRAKLLAEGVYDFAIMSKLSLRDMEAAKDVEVALDLGPHSYVSEHILLHAGDESTIKRVGVDPQSPDQMYLSNNYFKGRDIEYVSVPYQEILNAIKAGTIDGAICNMLDEDVESHDGLNTTSLSGVSDCVDASTAILAIRKGCSHMHSLIDFCVDREALLKHQSKVISGELVPSY